MTENRELHTRRLTEARALIPQWKEGSENAFAPEFSSWKQRVQHSLEQLFGKDHHYFRSFRHLRFWVTRMAVRGVTIRWAPQDQERFLDDLSKADQIIADALEELPSTQQPAAIAQKGTGHVTPSVVVNVQNILSQSATIDLAQLSAVIEALPLRTDTKEAAQNHAEKLAEEVAGKQRWPLMAKSLEALQALGKGVYEKVALPLLLEHIKRQSGL